MEGQQGLLRIMSDQLGRAEARVHRAEADRDTLVRLFGPRGGESSFLTQKELVSLSSTMAREVTKWSPSFGPTLGLR